jgi:hypothetical protein
MQGGIPPQRLPRILVVEPNPGSAEIIVEVLQTIGCTIAGPCRTLEQAARMADASVDGAVLEMRVAGSFSFELAASLVERGLAVVFFSQDAHEMLPDRLRSLPYLGKPEGITQLAEVARRTFGI